jgi:glycosyltransferase involved in cell wall biosynthesis
MKRKVLFIANTDWSFFHFWKPHLLKLKADSRFDIVLVCPEGPYLNKLLALGFTHIPYKLNRSGTNPFSELVTVFRIFFIIFKQSPDIVHNVTTKPSVYGSMAVWIYDVMRPFKRKTTNVNSFMGLGMLFSDQNAKLQKAMHPFFKIIFNRRSVYHTFSNPTDLQIFREYGFIFGNNGFVQLSESIDTNLFAPSDDFVHEKPRFLMAVRMLWSKGVREYVEAARTLLQAGLDAEFWLAGMPDDASPDAIPVELLEEWHNDGLIIWKRHVDDMATLIKQIDFVVLPSYYNEGAPRIIIEGMSSGKPVLATDIPGCRVLIRHGENGLLFTPRSVSALVECINYILKNPEKASQIAETARKEAVAKFDNASVSQQWLDFYSTLVSPRVTKN